MLQAIGAWGDSSTNAKEAFPRYTTLGSAKRGKVASAVGAAPPRILNSRLFSPSRFAAFTREAAEVNKKNMANYTATGWTYVCDPITSPSWIPSDPDVSPEPDGRGTFGILRSCVITLALCVYTAVHVNIPAAKASAWDKYGSKAGFVLAGMFAPELVILVAFCQVQRARRLTRELEAIFQENVRYRYGRRSDKPPLIEQQEEKDPEHGKRRHKWTQKHSFYAVMGGFAVDTNDAAEAPYVSLYPGYSGISPWVIATDMQILPRYQDLQY